MSSFPNVIYGSFGDEKATASTAIATSAITRQKKTNFGNPIGTRMVLPDGRAFRLAKASTAAAIGAGLVVQNPVAAASLSTGMDEPLAAAALVGATVLAISLTAVTVTVDAFAGGYVYVNDGQGEGHTYRIKDNTAISASGATRSFTVTLEDGEEIAVSCLAVTTQVGLYKNPYNGVIVKALAPSGLARGVTPTYVDAGYLFWAQTWGDCAVLESATVAAAFSAVIASTASTAGGISLPPSASAAATNLEQVIGYAESQAAVNTDYGHIFLTICP